jgi:hypothetical protein
MSSFFLTPKGFLLTTARWRALCDSSVSATKALSAKRRAPSLSIKRRLHRRYSRKSMPRVARSVRSPTTAARASRRDTPAVGGSEREGASGRRPSSYFEQEPPRRRVTMHHVEDGEPLVADEGLTLHGAGSAQDPKAAGVGLRKGASGVRGGVTCADTGTEPSSRSASPTARRFGSSGGATTAASAVSKKSSASAASPNKSSWNNSTGESSQSTGSRRRRPSTSRSTRSFRGISTT